MGEELSQPKALGRLGMGEALRPAKILRRK
jgi:hypothetical protein